MKKILLSFVLLTSIVLNKSMAQHRPNSAQESDN
ncbi:MAG: hypothetical protein Pg6B_06810 [Candidatus Azobacteroides pseudotrichonymphae]|jgi:hypothetical protein|nr:MAG: hypothetical protein Pg6B_06810 [Candidatus Azobacteroides pseudotrichonymphae]